MAYVRTLLVSGMLAPFASSIARVPECAELAPVQLGPIEPDDISIGYAYIDNDVCVSTVSIIGQYLRALSDADNLPYAVLSAAICRDCRSNNLEGLLRSALDRAGFASVRILRLEEADLHAAVPSPTDAFELSRSFGDSTPIGVFGPVPVLVTGEFLHTVTDRLEANGLHVVMPPLARLLGQRDVFEPALSYFHDAGIIYAIGVIPFGCMSGHAFARGRLRTLQREYPDLQITLIDYDPSASDINTVNRTELVIQSVFED